MSAISAAVLRTYAQATPSVVFFLAASLSVVPLAKALRSQEVLPLLR